MESGISILNVWSHSDFTVTPLIPPVVPTHTTRSCQLRGPVDLPCRQPYGRSDRFIPSHFHSAGANLSVGKNLRFLLRHLHLILRLKIFIIMLSTSPSLSSLATAEPYIPQLMSNTMTNSIAQSPTVFSNMVDTLLASASTTSQIAAFATNARLLEHKRKDSPYFDQCHTHVDLTLNVRPRIDLREAGEKSSQTDLHSLRRQLRITTDMLPTSPPTIVGHRGALYDCLENTRQGFLRCAQIGVDAVELDVFLLRDNTLAVFHGGGTDENPGDLSEYCVGQDGRNILDLTYDECLRLQFNQHFDEFPCGADEIARGVIPTLEQVLRDLKPTGCNVKVELKGPGTVEPSLKLVEELGMMNQVQFSSFYHDRLKLLRELRPDKNGNGQYAVRTGALFDEVPVDYLTQALDCGATEVHLRYDTCTVERVQAIHNAGLGTMAWFRGPVGMKTDTKNKFWDVGNEDEECYRVVMASGVQQLCCNRPVEALAFRNALYHA
jgi:glycerophosphoryl diester phosphodiesterase